jgi:hypothetical protein
MIFIAIMLGVLVCMLFFAAGARVNRRKLIGWHEREINAVRVGMNATIAELSAPGEVHTECGGKWDKWGDRQTIKVLSQDIKCDGQFRSCTGCGLIESRICHCDDSAINKLKEKDND